MFCKYNKLYMLGMSEARAAACTYADVINIVCLFGELRARVFATLFI